MRKKPAHSISLVGFMGVGKSAVGRLLARRTGIPFADVDALVERQAQATIAQIFAERGEPAFRSMEAETIAKLASASPRVIAAGGGAILNPQNLTALRLAGPVLLLTAEPKTLRARIARQPGSRPLVPRLEQAEARIAQLLRERQPAYAQADYAISTEGRTPPAVAREAERIWRNWGRAQTLALTFAHQGSGVVVQEGGLRQVGRLAAEAGLRGRVLVATDSHVAPLYLNTMLGSLGRAGFTCEAVILPAGERSKTWATARRILDRLAQLRMGRDDSVVALGGGVVGDVAGFAAAIYMRGINLVQVSTSLISQVDSALGGKTAVNHPAAKNLFGAFHHPCLVVLDPLVLRTLPMREFRAGLGEVVKYGAIADASLLDYLEEHTDAILNREPALLGRLVLRCCKMKASLVTPDERDTTGIREALNFGHTLGHALERAGGYRRLRHGEAISVGMVAAARLSAALGSATPEDGARIERGLTTLGLPVRSRADVGELLATAGLDKKTRKGKLRYVLLDEGLGKTRTSEVGLPTLLRVWRQVTSG